METQVTPPPNPDEEEMNRMLSEFGEIVQSIQNHKGPLNINQDAIDQIQAIEQVLTWFDEVSDAIYPPEQSIEKKAAQIANMKDKDKQFLKRAQMIKKDARKLLLNYSKEIERGKQRGTPEEAESQKMKRKERRKLFKPLGGDKKWIPL